MIKATRKPIEEILDCVRNYNRILVIGCGGCVSVCFAGGQPEVRELTTDLEYRSGSRDEVRSVNGYTVERQCNSQFLSGLDDLSNGCDCLLSMACGAGVQFLAERYPGKPVYPAVNTVFIGIDRAPGLYEEKCRACGECVLAYTAGICPVTRCAKSLFNGPCGGTNKGSCEIHKDQPCAWFMIYERLCKQNRLENIMKIKEPNDWSNQVPRTTIQPGYQEKKALNV